MPATANDRLNGLTTSQAVKPPCRVATTANITLSGEQTIDGVAVVAGDRVLVTSQTTQSQNGIYVVRATAWDRAKDFDGTLDVVTGTLVLTRPGTSQARYWEVTTANPITIGTSSITFQAVYFNNDRLAIYEEVQTATAGQTVFDIATFTYSINTKSIFVLLNGRELRRGTDYTETSATRVTMTAPMDLGAEITFRAQVHGAAAGDSATAAAASAAAASSSASSASSSAAAAASSATAAEAAAMQLSDYAALRSYNGGLKSVYITGYLVTAAPSGIAGLFTRDDSDVTSADNGGTIIIDAQGRRFKRVFTGPLRLKWFGAKGDFVLGSMTGTDDTTAITNCFAAASLSGIKAVHTDDGVYGLASPITISGDDWALTGDSLYGSLWAGINDADMLRIDVSTTYSYRGSIRNMGFARNSATYSNTRAIRAVGNAAVEAGVWGWVFDSISFQGVWKGVYFDETRNQEWPLASGLYTIGSHSFNTFHNLQVPLESNGRYPDRVVHFPKAIGAHNEFIGGQYRSETYCIEAGDGGALNGIGDTLFDGIHFVLGTAAIKLSGPSDPATYDSNILVTGCQFDGMSTYACDFSDLNHFKIIEVNTTNKPHNLVNCANYFVVDERTWKRSDTTTTDIWDANIQFGKKVTIDSGDRLVLNGRLNLGAGEAVTIASGTANIGATLASKYIIDTEASAATDDLDNLTAGTEGDLITIYQANSARDVTVRHIGGGTGNIRLTGDTDIALANVSQGLELWYRGGLWVQEGYRNNVETTGTWTPVITFATPGDLAVTYSTQAGAWTRHGRLMVVQFQIQTSAFTHTTAAGDFQITGFPVANNASNIYTGSLTFSGVTLGAGYYQVQVQIGTGASLATLRVSGSAVAAANLGVGNFPTGGTVILRGTLVYHV